MIPMTNSDSIPIDLIVEILSRLPATSLARLRCVSKLWKSMLYRSDFTELFLTKSRARPRLLFAVNGANGWRFYSSPQPQNSYDKSTPLAVAANFQTKFSGYRRFSCTYDSGLIYISGIWISEDDDAVPMIGNSSTGDYAIVPAPAIDSCCLLGFDPIDKQFKLLSIDTKGQRILTLGTEIWRDIQCPFIHEPYRHTLVSRICFNGILYYLVTQDSDMSLVVCFDVRSEKFKLIEMDSCGLYSALLVNYKGKLGVIDWQYVGAGKRRTLELRMWVLEDVEKQEWSKHIYTTPENEVFDDCCVYVAGVTTRGEIVLTMDYLRSYTKLFYVFYFNPERNTLQAVEIQGVGKYHEAFENLSKVYVDYVEDLNFIT